MSIRDILLLVDENSSAACDAAAALASSHHAMLTVAGLVPDTAAALAFSEASSALLAEALEAARAAAEGAVRASQVRANKAGLHAELELVRSTEETIESALGRLLRRYDLTVVQQPDPDYPSERRMMIDTALFTSGRPVLVVPYVQKGFSARTILIAWDGSSFAARALGDALPLLTRATKVEIVTVANPVLDTNDSGAAMTRHLSRHGVNAHFHPLASDSDVAGALLSYCMDAAVDLLVMGGYGHSRFREYVLGGTTREILHSMTLPVLMSH